MSEEPAPAARLRSHRLVVGKVDAGSGGRGRPAVRAVVHVTDATDERARKAPRGYSCAVSDCALVSLPEGVTLGRPPCLSPTNGLRAALHGWPPGPPLTIATKAVARQSPVHGHSGAVDTHLDFSKGKLSLINASVAGGRGRVIDHWSAMSDGSASHDRRTCLAQWGTAVQSVVGPRVVGIIADRVAAVDLGQGV